MISRCVRRRLEAGKIRNLVFEAHAAFPTPTTEFLSTSAVDRMRPRGWQWLV